MPDQPLSREELEASLKQVTEELDKPEEPVVIPEDQPDQEEPKDIEEVREVPEVVEEPEEKEEKEEKEEPEEEEEETDYKELYKESSEEGVRLSQDKQKINQALHEARNITEPTEDELKQEYNEWDLMSEVEKRLAKDNLIYKRRFDRIDQADQQRTEIKEWSNKVDTYIENPKTLIANPELEGKQDKFKTYAKDKTRRGVNFDMILKSFLYDETQSKVKHTGKMLETGKGGDKKISNPNDGKISIEESARLRDSNYGEYMRLLQQGKIRTDID